MSAAGAGGVNNPPPDGAVGSGETGPPILDELYDTLADVERGIDLRDREAEDLKKQVLEAEQELLAQRDQAEQADDAEGYKQATAELEELRRAWLTLTDEETGLGPDKPEDGADDGGRERPGDRGDRDPGHDSAVADPEGDRNP